MDEKHKQIFADNIDWDMLYEQKRALVKMIWNNSNDILWGLVYLLDSLQDAACEAGIWKFPETEEPVFPKWRLHDPTPSTGGLLWNMSEKKPYQFDGEKWVEITIEEYRNLLNAYVK